MMKLDSKLKYIIAVSGGSDSMALLDMCLKKKYDLVVAHVNYHVRDSADRDNKIVEDYCLKNNLILEVLNLKPEHKGNFEAWAREMRYAFFKKVGQKYQTNNILVAHQRDDLLETFLLQKERGSVPLFYGLNKINEFNDLCIIRPLLNYSKKELEEYCLKNKIEYGVDETNYLNDYQRNRIRNEVLAYKSETEKKQLLLEIEKKNKQLLSFKKKVNNCLNKCFNSFNKTNYSKYDQLVRIEALRQYLINNEIDARHFKNKYLLELDHILLSNKNKLLKIKDKYFDYSYGEIKICSTETSYHYTFEKIEKVKTNYFMIDDKGLGINAVTVSNSDFPLTIRNADLGDEIKLRFGHKRINRFFIDRKICLSDRLSWPVVLNNKGVIILISGIGCDIEHYSHKPNLFVLK